MVNASSTTSTSASGIISLLDEPSEQIQIFALSELEKCVAVYWPEISHIVGKIEVLYENPKFSEKKLAALLLSKVYYYLGEFNNAVEYALGAQDLFDLNKSSSSQYVDTIISKCIDKYIELKANHMVEDARLESIVERMFQRCFTDGEYKQAIGIALESKRLDIIEKAIQLASKDSCEELLKYACDVTMTLVQDMEFRNRVLRELVVMFRQQINPDYFSISKCMVWLNDVDGMFQILQSLIQGSDDQRLIAKQIAFDIYSSANQEFLIKLTRDYIKDDLLKKILSGSETIQLNLEFLFRNNKSDQLILTEIMQSVDGRSSAMHAAISICHGYMNAGTTSDKFLRDNMEWLSRASNWTKFTATSQLGVIHRGNLANSKSLLSPYLPQDSAVGQSPYVEGGALFAMGLIHANHGKEVLPYLLEKVKQLQNEVVQHGAALGIGAAGMATHDLQLYEALKAVLFTDSAVAGETAGMAMGLIMLGSGQQSAIDELFQYAQETQHEKIIRGCALGIAMILYGQEQKADATISILLSDKDPLLRQSGVQTIALAYAGTSSNKAIKDLLHLAVSDASDNVRRMSVSALGFVMCRNHRQVPQTVQLLSESFNPAVRYGSAMALGIACAGKASKEALDLLLPLTKDSVDYVRQAAYVAAAMILIQSNETNATAVEYRQMFQKVINTKHEDLLARFGAILATGIIDAGGRNVTLSLVKDGNVNMESVVGMSVFLQFWNWFPFAHFLSLSFTPTGLIGVQKDLKMPVFKVKSNAKPSLFAYQQPRKPKSDEKVEKIATAVLSTTAKAKARQKKVEKEKAADAMETDSPLSPTTPVAPEKKENAQPEPEPLFELLDNLSRVVPAQIPVVQFPEGSRYVPIKNGFASGILLMKDLKPSESEEFIEFSTPTISAASSAEGEKEADPPEPFEYVE